MTLERLLQLQGRLSRRDFLARMAVATGAGIIGCKNDGTTPITAAPAIDVPAGPFGVACT